MKPREPQVPTGTVIFIRHAESVANAGQPTSDPGKIPLSESGRTQAALAAGNYRGPRPTRLVTSPFIRARDTARAFQGIFPDCPMEIWPVQEFTYISPAKCKNTTAKDRRGLVARYWTEAAAGYVDGDGAESFAEFLQRVDVCVNRLAALPGPTLIFTHEIFMKAVLWRHDPTADRTSPFAFRTYCGTFAIPNLGRVEHRDGKAELGEGLI